MDLGIQAEFAKRQEPTQRLAGIVHFYKLQFILGPNYFDAIIFKILKINKQTPM